MVRKNQDPGGSQGEDRISELPHHLINLILSFLPTRCVVSTSVLSKRWRYIWTSVPVIDLRKLELPTIVQQGDKSEEAERYRDQSLVDFVDRKFSLHHETRDLKKIYLDSRKRWHYENFRVAEWISTSLTRHNLEEFVFYSESLPGTRFFPSSGTFASLIILELDIWDSVNLPDAINFPNLKICRIRNAYLCSGDLTQQFFSNLPVLEELELTDCELGISELLISAPALKYLCITGPSESTDFYDTLPFYSFGISIFAPNLLSLRYADVPAEDYISHRFESLVDAEIDFKRLGVPLPEGKDPIATKVLEKLSNVKLLKISGETFEGLSFPDDLITNWPMFHNLVHLEVTTKVSFSKNKTLLNFLRFSPNLERIVIAKGFVKQLSSTNSGWTPDMVSQCMLSHLKSVQFCEFYGCVEELNTVKLFLENARVLQRMIIKFQLNLSRDKQNKVMKKLLKFPRSSTKCILEVS